MATVYFGFNGDHWSHCNRWGSSICDVESNKTCYLSSSHECNWFGSTCDSNKFITGINLEDMNLTGHFVPEMMYLSHLEILNLDGNKIMGKIDSHVGNLTKLKETDLDNNHLTGTIPEEMFKLANLSVLDLNDNYLSGTISSRIGEQRLYWNPPVKR